MNTSLVKRKGFLKKKIPQNKVYFWSKNKRRKIRLTEQILREEFRNQLPYIPVYESIKSGNRQLMFLATKACFR